MNSHSLFAEGRLEEAFLAAVDEVKRAPANFAARAFLASLFCFKGEWDRADRQLDVLGQQDTTRIIGVSLLRQLIRGEQARRECFDSGRVPEFLAPPSPVARQQLQLLCELRAGNVAGALALRQEIESTRGRCRGTIDDRTFDDFVDLDDRSATFFEVLTTNGKYYWVPFEQVRSIVCEPPERAIDLLWRRAEMQTLVGPTGCVYLPALYIDSHRGETPEVKLGHVTEWPGTTGGLARGQGQRIFQVGDAEVACLEFQKLEFAV